jgi:hypothetical protein
MPSAGTLTVKGDTRGIKKVTSALGRFIKRSDKADKKASRLGSTMKKIGGTLAAGLFVRKVIQNTIAQEQAIAQLNATLQSTGKFSKETSQALQDQAAALQDLTTFGDEAIISAQSLLLTFKGIGGETFPRATKSVLDLSAKMGMDLQSAVIQVGKALNDPITGLTMLTRVGITFTESQKDLIRELQKAGKLEEAQGVILEELESQFEGSAEAARNTLGGALKAVSNRFGDLLEGDGPTIQKATDALNELEQTLNSPEVKEGFATVVAGIVKIIEVGAQLPGTLGFLKDEIRAMFGDVDLDDIDRLGEKLVDLREDLDKSQNATFGGFADFFTDSRQENIAALEAEIAVIEALLDDFYNKPRDPVLTSAEIASGTIDFGDDLQEIEVKVELRDDEFRKISQKVAAGMRKVGEEATRELSDSVTEISAMLAGPAAEAALEYAEALAEIATWERNLIAAGQLSIENQNNINQARANAIEIRDQELASIEAERVAKEAELNDAERLIESLQFEAELRAASIPDRERMIALRYAGAEATEAEIATIERLIDTRQKEEEAIRAMDDFRMAATSAVAGFLDGAQSMGDAFDQFADRMKARAAQLIAEKLIEQIFGAFGTAGGGSGGGLGSLIAGLFSGGRAGGGTTYPGRIHPVNERGPELLTIGSRDYLMAGSQGGTITPAAPPTTNNRSTSIVVNLPPETMRRTADQTARKVGQVQRRAEARNS